MLQDVATSGEDEVRRYNRTMKVSREERKRS
jgi:hypothetical protein